MKIRINGELYDWHKIDPTRADAYEALANARDEAAKLSRRLDSEASKLVDATRREFTPTEDAQK